MEIVPEIGPHRPIKYYPLQYIWGTLNVNVRPVTTPHISTAATEIISHARRTQRAPPNKSKQFHFTVPKYGGIGEGYGSNS